MAFAESLARVKAAAADADKAITRDIGALTVPGFFGLDPWLLSIIIGAVMADDPAPNPETDRRRPLAAWKPKVKAKLDEWRETAKTEAAESPLPGTTVTPSLPPPAETAIAPLPTMTPRVIPAPVAEAVAVEPLQALPRTTAIEPIGVTPARVATQRPEQPVQLPPPPPPPALPPSVGSTGTLIPAPPPGMPEPLREAWIQAKVRAGEYARGLGSVIRQWPNDVEREQWAGENIVTEVDAETRRAKRQAIRDLTAQAVEKRWTPEKLASELGHKTQEWSRNWNRIARTELQAAHNEGVAISALRNDGPEARVARIPESNACADCKRLFLDAEGAPKIFTVAELAANGTNVGKPRADWVPSLWPIHPSCFPAGVKVATSRGSVAIEDVRVGDMVLSHDGQLHRADALWASRHQGALVHVVTASGRSVVATPSHPFITASGRVEAGALQLGDEVLALGVDVPLVDVVDPEKGPPKRSEELLLCDIVSGFTRSGVPVTAIHFDGHEFIWESEVDIPLPDGMVRLWEVACGGHVSVNDALVLGHVDAGLADSGGLQSGLATLRPPNRIVGRFREGELVSLAHLGHADKRAVAPVALDATSGADQIHDPSPRDSIPLSDGQYRLQTVEVKPAHCFGGWGSISHGIELVRWNHGSDVRGLLLLRGSPSLVDGAPPVRDAIAHDDVADGLLGAAAASGNLRDRNALLVEFDDLGRGQGVLAGAANLHLVLVEYAAGNLQADAVVGAGLAHVRAVDVVGNDEKVSVGIAHASIVTDRVASSNSTDGAIDCLVYSLSVEDAGTFTANGFVVSNCRCGTLAIPNGMTLNANGRLVAE